MLQVIILLRDFLRNFSSLSARVRSKKKSPQRARLQSSTFGGFLDLVKISEIRSEVGPKSDRSRTEVGPMSDRSPDPSPKSDRCPDRSRTEVRPGVGPKSEVGPKSDRFWPQLSLLAVLLVSVKAPFPYMRGVPLLYRPSPGQIV